MVIKLENDILSIQSQSSGKSLVIGKIVGRTLQVKRNPKMHLLKMWNAYGFNYEIFSDERLFDMVFIEQPDQNNYLVSRQDIMTYGQVYQAPQLDKQIFLSLEKLSELSTIGK